MTLAVVERMHQAALAKLSAITAIDGLQVERNRAEPVSAWPTLVLHDGDQVANADQIGFVEYIRTIEIDGFVRVAAKDDLGPALTALYAETVKALTVDVSLNGTAVDVVEGDYLCRMDPEGDTERLGEFSLKFDVTYTTRHGDPYTIAP